MRLEEIDIETWGSVLPERSFEVFHTPAALEVLDAHTTAEMRLFGAFKGQEPVGLVPIFVRSNPVGRLVTSPPPAMGVPRLGPLVFSNSPKQRKRESVNQSFAELLLEELDADSSRTLLRFECPIDFEDPRPYDWYGLRVGQSFTYVLNLADISRSAVMEGFSRDLRKEIRQSEDLDISVSVEGWEAARTVIEEVKTRYAEEGDPFPLTQSYVAGLADALGERCRVYVARDPDGEYLGGIIVLYSNDHASFWQGGVRGDYRGVSINSILHWTIIEDIVEGDVGFPVDGYDLVGANTPRLCRYKSKFGAELIPYYTAETDGVKMSVAKRAHALVSK